MKKITTTIMILLIATLIGCGGGAGADLDQKDGFSSGSDEVPVWDGEGIYDDDDIAEEEVQDDVSDSDSRYIPYDRVRKRIQKNKNTTYDFGDTPIKKIPKKAEENSTLNLYHDSNGTWDPIEEGTTIEFNGEIKATVSGNGNDYEWTAKINGQSIDIEKESSDSIIFALPEYIAGKAAVIRVIVKDDLLNENEAVNIVVTENPCLKPIIVKVGPVQQDGLPANEVRVSDGLPPYEWHGHSYSIETYDDKKELISNEVFDLPNLEDDLVFGELNEDSSVLRFGLKKNYEAPPGTAGYKIKYSVKVSDGCAALGYEDREKNLEMFVDNIKSAEMGTIADLKLQCDFGKIDRARGNASMGVYLFVDGDKVARVEYELKPCDSGNEERCEKPVEFVTIWNHKDGDYGGNDLSSYGLNDIDDIQIRFHKDLATLSASREDRGELIVDLRWCKLYTDKWVAVYDDEKKGNPLTGKIVGGIKENKGIHEFAHGATYAAMVLHDPTTHNGPGQAAILGVITSSVEKTESSRWFSNLFGEYENFNHIWMRSDLLPKEYEKPTFEYNE